MVSQSGSASTPALRGNYVLLRADSLRLLLPQHEVGAAEYLASPLQASDAAGILRQADDPAHRRFAALSAQMTLLPQCPVNRFVLTTLGDDDDDLGWCWNDIKVLIDIELRPQSVPAVLMAPYTPVDCFVDHDGEIAFLSTAQRLRTYAFTSRSCA